MKTTWISRAVLVSMVAMGAVVTGCATAPRYDALEEPGPGDVARPGDPGDPSDPSDPGDPGHPTTQTPRFGFPQVHGTPGEPTTPGGDPMETVTCIQINAATTIGAVRDTYLVEGDETSHGKDGTAFTGNVAGAPAQMLIRFELKLPANAKVRSATVTLHHAGDDAVRVRAHRVTAPWSDDTTWSSFANAFDPSVESAFLNAQGPQSFGIVPLTQAWVDGTVENDGVLLEQDVTGATPFRTSDWKDGTDAPTFDVCYAVPVGVQG